MSEEENTPQPDGPAEFLLGLISKSMQAHQKDKDMRERATSPSLTVRIPLAIVHKMLDQVTCNCEMCLGIYAWANSINTSELDEELQAIFRLSVVAAESRLLHERLSTAYRKTFQHEA